RKKTPTAAAATAKPEAGGASEESPEPPRGVTIHVPGEELGREGAVEPVEEPARTETEAAEEPTTAEAADEGAEVWEEPGSASAASPPTLAAKKKTRRGSRGGRSRKKKTTATSQNGSEAPADSQEPPGAEESSGEANFEYVPMSEWLDEIESKG